MSKYIPDVMSRRWVIVSTQRLGRPANTGKNPKKHVCPLCPGNESMTPPEVMRFGKGEANRPGWQVRVIPNKYPITDFHEVIIHSPDEDKDVSVLPVAHVELILRAYRDRYNFYRKNGQVMIFCNMGEHSGASLTHPHSQLVVIPSQINLDTLTREPLSNIVDTNTFFNVYCPDFSQWPYEVWIAIKKEKTYFGDIGDEELKDLAMIMQRTLKALHRIYDNQHITDVPYAYNYYIYPKDSWYMRIIPRFVYRAGFELGTGLSVNPVDPYAASMELRGVEDKVKHVLSKLKKNADK